MEPSFYKYDSEEKAFFASYGDDFNNNGIVKKLKRSPVKRIAQELLKHPDVWHQYFPGPSGGRGQVRTF